MFFVSQYTVYSPRANDDSIDFGESLGSLSIGMLRADTNEPEIPDPRFFSIKADVMARNLDFRQSTITELELVQITKENNQDYFYENSIHSDQMNEKGETNFLTIKNPIKVVLRDNIDSSAVNWLEFTF